MNHSSLLLFLLLLLLVVLRASCSLNLYINRTESKKILGGLPRYLDPRSIDRSIKKRFKTIQILLTSLLCFSIAGIEGDIYYIRDGQVKLNAVNFNMTVPSRVDCLRFIWYSKRIPSKPMVSNLAA